MRTTRTFLLSLLIFLLLAGCIVGNFFFIYNTTDRLRSMTNALPDADSPGCGDAVREIRTFWNERRNLVRLSVSTVDLNQCSSLLAALEAYADSGESAFFNAAKLQLLDAIDEVSRLETFRIGNLL